jgi:hypothetical protein
MKQKKIKITIDGKGNYTLQALEGFSGTSCVEQTRCIELSLGGTEVSEGKTSDYYDSDGSNPVGINLD